MNILFALCEQFKQLKIEFVRLESIMKCQLHDRTFFVTNRTLTLNRSMVLQSTMFKKLYKYIL